MAGVEGGRERESDGWKNQGYGGCIFCIFFQRDLAGWIFGKEKIIGRGAGCEACGPEAALYGEMNIISL